MNMFEDDTVVSGKESLQSSCQYKRIGETTAWKDYSPGEIFILKN